MNPGAYRATRTAPIATNAGHPKGRDISMNGMVAWLSLFLLGSFSIRYPPIIPVIIVPMPHINRIASKMLFICD